MKTRLDHLVIAAATLKQGVEYIKNTLGVKMPFGGAHPKMGTHNHLMQLGKDTFLEIISINPDAPAPQRPRWFALDSPNIRRKIAEKPLLLTWVVNTPDIEQLIRNASFDAGVPELITRGELSWHFALHKDGRLLEGGILPYAISWSADKHPSRKMADMDCRLVNLEIFHPNPEYLKSQLSSIGAENLVKISGIPSESAPYLRAQISTPDGIKTL